MNTLEIIHALDPHVIERARRLALAIKLLGAGMPRREVSGVLRRQFGVSQAQAWRVVQMAIDLGGPDRPDTRSGPVTEKPSDNPDRRLGADLTALMAGWNGQQGDGGAQ